MLGGRGRVAIAFMPTYVPLVKASKLRARLTSSQRAPVTDVMTVQEAGFAGFEATAGRRCRPTGTPADIVQKINTLVNAYLKSEKGKAHLVQYMQAAGGPPEDLKAYIAARARRNGARW